MKRFETILRLSLTGLFGCSLWMPASANQDGTSTAQFLRIAQGARAEGMGGAFTAIADDAYAVSWNPAGLSQITRHELALNHLKYIDSINSEFSSFVMPVNSLNGSLAASLTYLNFGSIDKLDQFGNPLGGDNSVNAYSGAISWGQAVSDRLGLGVTGKYFKQDLAGNTAAGFAGDVGGLLFLVPDRVSVGAALLNLGPKIKSGSTAEPIPLTSRLGVAWHAIPKQLVLDIDAEKERASSITMHVGGEYTYQNKFVIRGGYQDNKETRGGLSAGFGFIWRPGEKSDFFGNAITSKSSSKTEIRFDYGFVDYGDFDTTHRFGVQVGF